GGDQFPRRKAERGDCAGAVCLDRLQAIAGRRRHVERRIVAVRDAAAAAEEAVPDAGDAGEGAGLLVGNGHAANPAGSSPGLAAQKTLKSSPMPSAPVRRATAAAMAAASPGLASASARARSAMPR